jgi:hypothetical protein
MLAMRVAMQTRRRIDRHTAHRIDGALGGAMRMNRLLHDRTRLP